MKKFLGEVTGGLLVAKTPSTVVLLYSGAITKESRVCGGRDATGKSELKLFAPGLQDDVSSLTPGNSCFSRSFRGGEWAPRCWCAGTAVPGALALCPACVAHTQPCPTDTALHAAGLLRETSGAPGNGRSDEAGHRGQWNCSRWPVSSTMSFLLVNQEK